MDSQPQSSSSVNNKVPREAAKSTYLYEDILNDETGNNAHVDLHGALTDAQASIDTSGIIDSSRNDIISEVYSVEPNRSNAKNSCSLLEMNYNMQTMLPDDIHLENSICLKCIELGFYQSSAEEIVVKPMFMGSFNFREFSECLETRMTRTLSQDQDHFWDSLSLSSCAWHACHPATVALARDLDPHLSYGSAFHGNFIQQTQADSLDFDDISSPLNNYPVCEYVPAMGDITKTVDDPENILSNSPTVSVYISVSECSSDQPIATNSLVNIGCFQLKECLLIIVHFCFEFLIEEENLLRTIF